MNLVLVTRGRWVKEEWPFSNAKCWPLLNSLSRGTLTCSSAECSSARSRRIASQGMAGKGRGRESLPLLISE